MPESSTPTLPFAETTVDALLDAASSRYAALQARPRTELERDVRAEMAAIVDANARLVLDAPTAMWLQRTALVLAVHRTLSPLIDDKAGLVDVLRAAMVEPFKGRMADYLASRFGISSDAPHEAFARIAENFKSRGEERFGKSFVYVRDVQDADRDYTNIHRCFFNDFFRLNDAPELIAIFCALDSVWVDALHAGDYGVRFERPTMLSKGGDACRFQFNRSPTAADNR